MGKSKKTKIYAVRNGKHGSRIYLNWPEALNATDGFSKAQCKGFDTMEEARRFLSEGENGRLPRVSPGLFPDDKALYVHLEQDKFEGAYQMELRSLTGHKVKLRELIFATDPVVAEFLALVSCLSYCKRTGSGNLIYTGCKEAIQFIKDTGAEQPADAQNVKDSKAWLLANNHLNPCVQWLDEWGNMQSYPD